MNNTKNKHNRITKYDRIQKRRYNRITITTVVTTVCVLATSITVIAAPMKQNSTDVTKKLTLPGAGMNRVVSDFAEIATNEDFVFLTEETDRSAASDTLSALMSGVNSTLKKTAELASFLPEEAVAEAEEPVSEDLCVEEESFYEEPVYEESFYEEPVYEEPVYEESVDEEPIYEEPAELYEEDTEALADTEEGSFEEEIFYEPETFLDEIFYEEEPVEETETEDESFVEAEEEEPVVYEEETLEEFLEEQETKLEEQAENRQEQEEDVSETKASNVSLGQTIANDACQYVGWLPYIWAGASLETGADCSGFTMAVYAKYGYNLSHDSEVQSCEGRSVPLSEAQPGDIVVYSGHVAMYIGNGQIVHSPTPGQCVSIASVNMMPVLDVRRIID